MLDVSPTSASREELIDTVYSNLFFDLKQRFPGLSTSLPSISELTNRLSRMLPIQQLPDADKQSREFTWRKR